MDHPTRLFEIYDSLYAHFGPLGWWPGDTAFEIAVGAILTQNTSWRNVERTIENLKRAEVLQPDRLYALPEWQLAENLRPSGYFNVKAKRLRAFLKLLVEDHGSDMQDLCSIPLHQLRPKLLEVRGIGPETADSICLYAAGQPIFVIDAYTKRIFSRLGLADETDSYEDLQSYFMQHLPHEVPLFNEYHAQIVYLGKDCCRPTPRCVECPLGSSCQFAKSNEPRS